MALEFAGAATPLGPDDVARVAAQLGVEPATIAAVCDVESAGGGFLPDKRPKILFERHLFHRLTGGRYDASHPGISNPSAGGYGASGAHQFDRLAEAITCDRAAALQAPSWGRFQILGLNAAVCGYANPDKSPNVEAFVAAMSESEANHLAAFAAFCKGNNLVRYLVSCSWSSFAAGYNGPGNVADYGSRLAAAYQKHRNDPAVSISPLTNVEEKIDMAPSASANPVDLIRQAQRALGIPDDGDPGPATRQKLHEWRAAHPGA